jgi:putative transposase
MHVSVSGTSLSASLASNPRSASCSRPPRRTLIAFYQLPAEHWTKLRSTNPLERINKQIGRRTDVVGIFPNDQAVIRLAGALLSEQNDEWLVRRRYLSVKSIALIATPQPEQPTDPKQLASHAV